MTKIKIKDIIPFKDHPYKVEEDDSLKELMDSIEKTGLIHPVIVREKNNKYEMISGHRRLKAYELLGIDEIEADIKELTDDEAIVFMVDSNIHREKILPSEKAFAYKMKLDAIKHQGKASATGLHRSREDVGIANDESGETVRRYVRLTYLIPELLQLVDDTVKYGKNQILTMGIKPAVEISYLSKEEQKLLYSEIIYEELTPSHAQAIGKEKLVNYYQALGFGKQTGIELANEYQGSLKSLISSTSDVELATSSFGQGIVVTPIQMIQALSSITNNGTPLKPYIIEKVVNPNTDEVVYQAKRTELGKVYSTSTVDKIKELMDMTVNGEDGARTGRYYASSNVRIIGKTGTANYTDKSGKYLTGTYQTIKSFAGVFPKDKPEYILYVAVKDFQGSSTAFGKVVSSTVESISKYKNIDERESDADTSKIVTISNYANKDINVYADSIRSVGLNPIIIGDGNRVIAQYPKRNTTISAGSKVFLITNSLNYIMPDMTGWSSTEFVDFCNLIGVKYDIDGYGYVTSTSIAPGIQINLDETITATCTTITPASLVTKHEEG